jgi:hypothetical protein
MAYALIPDGFTLKKVTKLQKRAIDEKRMHDDTIALLNNPNTPLVAGAAGLVIATPFIVSKVIPVVIEQLQAAGASITDDIVKVATDKSKETLIDIAGTAAFRLSPLAPFTAVGGVAGVDLEKRFEEFIGGLQ